jgi:5'-nucleotidase
LRKGDWILVYPSAGAYWVLDPRPEEVHLEDIAHHLSMLCRYNGGVREFYSIAQHSCIVSDNLPWDLAAQGLMHDAAEYVCGDMVRPVKKNVVGYDGVEELNARAIGTAFGMDLVNLPALVHEADMRALFTEKRDLRPPEPRTDHCAPPGLLPYTARIRGWSPERARDEFLDRARRLGIARSPTKRA